MANKKDCGIKVEKKTDIDYGLDFNFSIIRHENGDLESGLKITDSEGLDFSTEVKSDNVEALSQALMGELSEQLSAHCLKMALKKKESVEAQNKKKQEEKDALNKRLENLDKEREQLLEDLEKLQAVDHSFEIPAFGVSDKNKNLNALYKLFYY